MLDALKQLFENDVISNEVKESIEQAWDKRVTENREQVAQQLREEFAQKYDHDKNVMIEAMDRMITDGLINELSEFAEDRKQLAEMKIKYARKMNEDAKVMREFVTRELAREIRELHEDQVGMAEKFGKLEEFVVEALAEEITEFHTDKRELAETRVRVVKEGKEQLRRVKEQFVKRAAKNVEQFVNECLATELHALKEDIDSARRNDFGRRIVEAFAAEYENSYLNERSETAKLLKVIDLKEKNINESKQKLKTYQKLVESKEAEIKSLKESQERKAIINELIAPLNREQRVIMKELMENVKTSKLTESFDKYLPAVISGKNPQKKQALVEATVTGNRKSNSTQSSDEDNTIVSIRRLAGLKV